MLAWFDTKAVDALAAAMARDLAKRVPPASIDAEGKKAEAKQTFDKVLAEFPESPFVDEAKALLTTLT